MPSDGTGAGWDVTLPADSCLVSDVPIEARETKKAHQIRVEKEHNPYGVASAGGEHKQGSAKAYHQASYPTLRPNGATALSSADAGRLLIRSDTGHAEYWDGTGWTKVNAGTFLASSIYAADIRAGEGDKIISYAVLVHKQSDGVDGGTFTSGAWRTRPLTSAARTDTQSIVSVASNQFTLAAGIYRVRARFAAQQVNAHQIRLRDITNSATVAYGSVEQAPSGVSVQTYSCVEMQFEVSGSTIYEIQHQCNTTKSGSGMGQACGFGGEEIFGSVEIYKVL